MLEEASGTKRSCLALAHKPFVQKPFVQLVEEPVHSKLKHRQYEYPGQENSIRVVGGEVTEDTAFGVVEVFHAGAWGTFCNGETRRFDYMSLDPPVSFDDVRFCRELWSYLVPSNHDARDTLRIVGASS